MSGSESLLSRVKTRCYVGVFKITMGGEDVHDWQLRKS
jgi:hypothetical protein